MHGGVGQAYYDHVTTALRFILIRGTCTKNQGVTTTLMLNRGRELNSAAYCRCRNPSQIEAGRWLSLTGKSSS